jgi:hypothetical protein
MAKVADIRHALGTLMLFPGFFTVSIYVFARQMLPGLGARRVWGKSMRGRSMTDDSGFTSLPILAPAVAFDPLA